MAQGASSFKAKGGSTGKVKKERSKGGLKRGGQYVPLLQMVICANTLALQQK